MRRKGVRLHVVGITIIALLFGVAVEAVIAATKQELIVNRKGEGVSLDPAKTTAMEDYAVMENIYSSLFRFKPNSFELRPDLAVDYKTSSDGKVVTFNLRKGVKWHKGYGEFTSEDVKFTIDRILDPATQSRFATNFANIERVEVDGPHGVKFYLKAPDATLLQRLTVTRPSGGLIVSKKAVTDLGDKYASQPVGTGPFVFESHVPREKIVLVANKDYYEGSPKLERVVFVPIGDETTAAMALESGDIHVSQFENIELLESYKNHKSLRVITGARVTDHMILMNTRKAPFDNLKVRQAMAYGINRDEIIAGILGGYADMPTGVIHPDMFGYNKDVKTYPYDPGKAKALLKEAGYQDGFKTEIVVLTYGTWQKVNELIKAQLSKIGIDMKIQMLERGSYVKARAKDDTDLVMFGITQPPDPDFILGDVFHSSQIPPGGLNLSRYDQVDDLIVKGRAETDPKKRAAIYAKIDEKMAEDVPTVVLYHPKWTEIISKQVKNYSVERLGGFWLYPVSLE